MRITSFMADLARLVGTHGVTFKRFAASGKNNRAWNAYCYNQHIAHIDYIWGEGSFGDEIKITPVHTKSSKTWQYPVIREKISVVAKLLCVLAIHASSPKLRPMTQDELADLLLTTANAQIASIVKSGHLEQRWVIHNIVLEHVV